MIRDGRKRKERDMPVYFAMIKDRGVAQCVAADDDWAREKLRDQMIEDNRVGLLDGWRADGMRVAEFKKGIADR